MGGCKQGKAISHAGRGLRIGVHRGNGMRNGEERKRRKRRKTFGVVGHYFWD
jgi:hypothetical protein